MASLNASKKNVLFCSISSLFTSYISTMSMLLLPLVIPLENILRPMPPLAPYLPNSCLSMAKKCTFLASLDIHSVNIMELWTSKATMPYNSFCCQLKNNFTFNSIWNRIPLTLWYIKYEVENSCRNMRTSSQICGRDWSIDSNRVLDPFSSNSFPLFQESLYVLSFLFSFFRMQWESQTIIMFISLLTRSQLLRNDMSEEYVSFFVLYAIASILWPESMLSHSLYCDHHTPLNYLLFQHCNRRYLFWYEHLLMVFLILYFFSFLFSILLWCSSSSVL